MIFSFIHRYNPDDRFLNTVNHGLDIKLESNQLQFIGNNLQRPECILCTARGHLFSADWRGGVAHILPNGEQRLYLGHTPDGQTLRPNGIALNADGSFLLADLGEEKGGVFRLTRTGEVSVYLDRVDGIVLPPTNYVFSDLAGRTWITVSTRKVPRAAAYRGDVADGFIVLVDEKGPRIVADHLAYTNEVAVHPDGKWLYVNETFGRRLSRFRIGADGSLLAREVVTEFGSGTYPDGISFDIEGHAWITSIISNRVIRVAPDGTQTLILEDVDPAHLEWTETAFQMNTLGRVHLDRPLSTCLKNVSSLSFGGKDLSQAYLGCLQGNSIAHFPVNVAGHPRSHWNYT